MKKKLKLTNTRMQLLIGAIQSIDGYSYIRKDGGEPVYVLFSLGAVRLDLAKIAGALQPHLEAFEKARVALVNQHKQVEDLDPKEAAALELRPGHPNWAKFEADFTKMRDAEEDVELNMIDEKALKLDEGNELPILALAALSELIKE